MFNHALAFVMSVIASDKREEKGATAVEYALVIGLVSLVLVGLLAVFGTKLTSFISGISFGTAAPAPPAAS
jgi:pilus assembly protein Flp/PilA